MTHFIVLLAFITLWSQERSSPKQSVEKMTICQILARVSELDGRMVEVRAKFAPDEYLDGEQDCKGEVKLGSKVFRKRIWLTWPDADGQAFKAPFEFNASSEARYRVAIRRAAESKTELFMTVTGLIRTRTDPRLYVYGFGPEDDSPCGLIISEAREFETNRSRRKD